MSSKKSTKEGNKLTKYVKKSVTMSIKAWDVYIQSMKECSDKVILTTVMGCPIGHINTLPGSYSVISSKSGNKIDLEFQKRQQQVRQSPATPGKNNMPRSYSAGIGRIEKDKPF